MEARRLYYYTSLETFFRMLTEPGRPAVLRWRAGNILYTALDTTVSFGLGLIREAIVRYERIHAVPAEKSKAPIPFLRNDRLKLIGFEDDIYTLPLYESDEQEALWQEVRKCGPGICFGLDYEELAEICLLENIALLKADSDAEAFVRTFLDELEKGEYDKFQFDDEHTGFARDSRLLAYIRTACSKLIPERSGGGRGEWRLCLFKTPEEVDYACENGTIIPYFSLELPASALCSICVRPAAHASSADLLPTVGALKMLLEKHAFFPEKIDWKGGW